MPRPVPSTLPASPTLKPGVPPPPCGAAIPPMDMGAGGLNEAAAIWASSSGVMLYILDQTSSVVGDAVIVDHLVAGGMRDDRRRVLLFDLLRQHANLGLRAAKEFVGVEVVSAVGLADRADVLFQAFIAEYERKGRAQQTHACTDAT